MENKSEYEDKIGVSFYIFKYICHNASTFCTIYLKFSVGVLFSKCCKMLEVQYVSLVNRTYSQTTSEGMSVNNVAVLNVHHSVKWT